MALSKGGDFLAGEADFSSCFLNSSPDNDFDMDDLEEDDDEEDDDEEEDELDEDEDLEDLEDSDDLESGLCAALDGALVSSIVFRECRLFFTELLSISSSNLGVPCVTP